MTEDLATREHWDREHGRSADEVPDFSRLQPDLALRRFIARHVQPTNGCRLIELGAGNTAYLPQLANAFGFRVAGLDYSPLGCKLARRNLDRFGIEGEIREADLFTPPSDWLEAFDVVFTMGVAEHFDDTAAAIRGFRAYARPGAFVITVIPNMRGTIGPWTRFLSRDLYNRHVPMDPAALALAHAAAGLEVKCAGYLAGINYWVVNPGVGPRWKRVIFMPMLLLTRLAWALEDRGWLRIRPNRWSSPWVVVLATVPTSGNAGSEVGTRSRPLVGMAGETVRDQQTPSRPR